MLFRLIFCLIASTLLSLTRAFNAVRVPRLCQTNSLPLSKKIFNGGLSCLDLSSSSSETNEDGQPNTFEYLKFGGTSPSFDVVEKTKGYIAARGNNPESIYADNYVLRGPVIGPLTRKDLTDTQGGFDILTAFPDLHTDPFGFTADPENPYRCFFFEKYRGTHTGTLVAGSKSYEGSGRVMEGPVHVNAVVWNPEGKIIYEAVGNVVDRHEGNTEGKAAVFGLLHTAGIRIPGTPGSRRLRLLQRLGHILKNGRSFSKEEDIPKWWKSKARGADPTDPSP